MSVAFAAFRSTAFMSVAFISVATGSFTTALAASLFSAGLGHASSARAIAMIVAPATILRIGFSPDEICPGCALNEMQRAQQRIVARLILQRREERVAQQVHQAGILLRHAFVEHIQRLIDLVPLGEDLRLLVKPVVALRLDQLFKCGLCFGFLSLAQRGNG